MISYFDYIYYRVTKFYSKWDGNKGINGILIIGLIQVLVICDILLWVTRFFFNISKFAPHSKTFGIIGVVMLLCLILINNNNYKNKFDKLSSKWANEARGESILKGTAMVLSFIIPWLPLVIFGIRK